ncbi:MAG: hypothetical protein ACR652_10120 [Methylocystis sp.]|uniref:hypothetical protein n=1 Tax=Methylocystis sp. TaxID=1911079 RepID=UPI003DA33D47
MTRQTFNSKSTAQQERNGSWPSPADPRSDGFGRFLAAFPERDEPHDAAAARQAWARALRRADPEAIIAAAAAYARAREGQPARFTMAARRWLQEGKWRDGLNSEPVQPLVWIALDAPGWREWEAFYRATKGKTPPIDRRGGWRFPSRWPPSMQAAE